MIAALRAGLCVALILSTRVHATPGSPPEVTVSLAAWGLKTVDALAFANVGVLETDPARLVVYHLGSAEPAASPPTTRSAPAPMAGDGFVVARLDGDNRNRLGGFFNGFAKAPARAEVSLEETGEPAALALAFEFDKRPGTFAGFWLHLFDTRAALADRVYLDARGAAWLTFEVKGDVGGEPVRLQLADGTWEAKQDSWPVDDVSALIDDGQGRIGTDWRRAWFALDRLDQLGTRLDRSRLASLVFLVDPEGQGARKGRIWIREVALTSERVAPAKVVRQPAAAAKPERKAMWLWETPRIIDSAAELERLVGFCRAQALTDLFVQIPYLEPLLERQWGENWNEAGMRRLIGALAEAGVRVHALDGAAFYVRPQWHSRLGMTVEQLARYNRASPPRERFAGVRFDVEPYLLPEWQGADKEAVLEDYLALLEQLAPLARAGGLEFGVDIPFWFDGRDELTGELAAPIDGRPVLGRVLDIADNIGLMDYRTVAFGADGVVAHGADELTLAAQRGKEVFIGLETVPLPDERLVTFTARRSRSGSRASGESLAVVPLGDGRASLMLIPPGGEAPPGARVLALRDALRVPADKITFSNLGRAALERTMALARPALAAYPSFLGFVLHSYESLAPWYPPR